MALSSVRLRRILSLSSYIINYHRPSLSAVASITSSPPPLSSVAVNPSLDLLQPQLFPFQSRHFRSSSVLLLSYRKQNINSDEIGPDTILFEGCDFNHWLITMDFPKDPAPSREEMIETYLQTLAKVVGSYEEAKKKMYAFSTTTYQGFQCLVTEEMSEKFRGLPGVVFILPDSYIDPVNKEYGGDKYENGVITPRPPPTQYGRRRAYDDRPNQRRGPMPNQQGNMRPMYGGDTRNFGPQQNLGPQNSQMQPNYGPGGAGDRRDPMTMNNAPGGRDTMPPYQAQNDRGYYNPQGGRSPVEQSDYVPPGQRNMSGDNRNYGPPQGVNNGQGGGGGNYGQMAGGNYGQGLGGNYQQGVGAAHSQRHPMAGSNYGQGAGGNYGQGVHADYTQQTPVAGGNYGQGVGGNYGQGVGATHTQQTPVTGGNYGQGVGAAHMQRTPMAGSYGQGEGNYGQGVGAAHMQQTPMAGSYGQGVGATHMQQTPMAGSYGQGEGNYGQGVDATDRQEMGSGYGQSYPGHGEHNFSSMEPRNNMQEQRNYTGMAHPGTDQARY